MKHGSSYRSTLKQARGLGSGHAGTGHFWLQRVTAVMLIPLSIWFMVKLTLALAGQDRMVVADWLHEPISALLLTIFMVAMILHARLGIQTIIEDYVHGEGCKLVMLLLNSGIKLLLVAASVMAIVHLHFNGI